MSQRGRDTLKRYFAAGELPTEQAFAELIESMLHMEDEGFRRSDEHGLHVTSASGSKALLTFFQKETNRAPQWTVRYGGTGEQLNLQPRDDWKIPDARPLLSLNVNHRIGVSTADPQHRLHVEGFVGSTGRAGTHRVPSKPKADGGWHVLADGLSGCVAFEVVASASKPDSPRHAVMHAVAVNACNPTLRFFDGWFKGWVGRNLNRRKRIRASNAWWSARCDRLELQWQPSEELPGKYALALRTMCDYGGSWPIEVHVTKLFPVDSPPSLPTGRTVVKPKDPVVPKRVEPDLESDG